MDIGKLGDEGTYYIESPWSEFSCKYVPGIENPHNVLYLFFLYPEFGFSDVGFPIWGACEFIFIDIIFHNQCYISWIFSLVLTSLEENHLQDEGVCCLAEGLKRNSSLKILK